jgi:hypothetical protein
MQQAESGEPGVLLTHLTEEVVLLPGDRLEI